MSGNSTPEKPAESEEPETTPPKPEPKPPKPAAKPKKEAAPLNAEPSIIDTVDPRVANMDQSLEPDTSVAGPMQRGPEDISTEGWQEFDPTCKECNGIITSNRADKCPVEGCNVIMHPYCYYQHFMRHHLPQPVALEVHVAGSLQPDGTYSDYKGFIKP